MRVKQSCTKPYYIVFCCFETRCPETCCVDEAGLELRSTCLGLLNAGIKDVAPSCQTPYYIYKDKKQLQGRYGAIRKCFLSLALVCIILCGFQGPDCLWFPPHLACVWSFLFSGLWLSQIVSPFCHCCLPTELQR